MLSFHGNNFETNNAVKVKECIATFQKQQWLCKHDTMLFYPYTAYLVRAIALFL